MTITMPQLDQTAVAAELARIKPVLALTVEDPSYRGHFAGIYGDELIEAQYAQLCATRKLLTELAAGSEDIENDSWGDGHRSYLIQNDSLPEAVIGKTVAELISGISFGFGYLELNKTLLAEQLDAADVDDAWESADYVFEHPEAFFLNADRSLVEVTND